MSVQTEICSKTDLKEKLKKYLSNPLSNQIGVIQKSDRSSFQSPGIEEVQTSSHSHITLLDTVLIFIIFLS